MIEAKKSEKLKRIMAEFRAIMEKEDIAGFVAIHEPGATEYLNWFGPSYSAAYITEGQFRVKIKQAEVGREKAYFLAENTYNMVKLLSDTIAYHAHGYLEFEKMLAKHLNAEAEGPGMLDGDVELPPGGALKEAMYGCVETLMMAVADNANVDPENKPIAFRKMAATGSLPDGGECQIVVELMTAPENFMPDGEIAIISEPPYNTDEPYKTLPPTDK